MYQDEHQWCRKAIERAYQAAADTHRIKEVLRQVDIHTYEVLQIIDVHAFQDGLRIVVR